MRVASPFDTADLYLIERRQDNARVARARRHSEPGARARRRGNERRRHAWRDSDGRRGVDARDAGAVLRTDRPVPSHPRRAGLGRLLGGVALLQRPRPAMRASTSPFWSVRARADGRRPRACGCSSIATGTLETFTASARRSPTPTSTRAPDLTIGAQLGSARGMHVSHPSGPDRCATGGASRRPATRRRRRADWCRRLKSPAHEDGSPATSCR